MFDGVESEQSRCCKLYRAPSRTELQICALSTLSHSAVCNAKINNHKRGKMLSGCGLWVGCESGGIRDAEYCSCLCASLRVARHPTLEHECFQGLRARELDRLTLNMSALDLVEEFRSLDGPKGAASVNNFSAGESNSIIGEMKNSSNKSHSRDPSTATRIYTIDKPTALSPSLSLPLSLSALSPHPLVGCG